jgi:antirestriction protein ArdC
LSGSKYASEFWLTYKQAQDLGGHVKQGEKAELVVFWKFLTYEDTNKQPGEFSHKEKQVPMLRHYHVFNVEQCEGIDYAKLAEQTPRESNPIESAEAIVATMPNLPRLVIDGTPKAYYSPAQDFVHMTQRSACVSDSAYYDTLFHELTHATGHQSRLDRMEHDTAWCRFGSKPYANEELVAEMGAAMLCAESGIFQETEENSAAYIANWLSKLESDHRLVVHAAGKAQRAADWILGETEKKE